MDLKTPSNNIEQLQLDYGSFWEFSSVWLECFLDMEEVVGPNPTTPTSNNIEPRTGLAVDAPLKPR